MTSRTITRRLLRACFTISLAAAVLAVGGCGGGDAADSQSAADRRAVAALQRHVPPVASVVSERRLVTLAVGDPAADPIDAASQLMDFGEATFPTYFPGKQANRIVSNVWAYRYYPPTQAYLAVIDNRVLVLGGPFGPEVRDVGAVTDFITPRRTRPTANAGSDRSVVAGSLVALDGSGSADPNGDTLSYRWTLSARPGTSRAVLSGATTSRPSFTADTVGAYTAQLVVNDGKLDSVVDAVTITAVAPNRAPVANAGVNMTGLIGTVISLNGTSSQDPDGDSLTYRWTLTSAPAGSGAQLTLATTARPQIVPDTVGTFTVRLIVNDGRLDSSPALVTVTALPVSAVPIANAGPDRETTMRSAVELDGSASRDNNGEPLTYLWEFVEVPSGASASIAAIPATANASRVAFTSDTVGRHVMRLTVSNRSLSASDQMVVTVVNRHLSLDGVSAYAVENEDFVGLASPLDVSTFTVEAWIYPQRDEGMFLLRDGAFLVKLVLDQGLSKVDGGMWLDATTVRGFAHNSSLTPNRWIHISFSFNAATRTCRISVGGRVEFAPDCLPASQSPLTSVDMLFGIGIFKPPGKVDRSVIASSMFRGAIDEVRISSIVRYTSSFTPARSFVPDESTLGLWHFDEPPGATRFEDASGRGRHLNGVGGATTAPGTR